MKAQKFKCLHIFLNLLLKNIQKCDIILSKNGVNTSTSKQVNNSTANLLRKPTKDFKQKGFNKIMCKASEVAKIVINKCLDTHIPIDVQKLQKLLVLMQVECIKQSGKPLFKEDIRVWKCGVAIKEVDEDFRFDESAFKDPHIEYISLLDAEESSVDYILMTYGTKNSFELNDLHINQKVISLGVINPGDTVPHISFGVLIGAFGLK